MQIDIVKTPGFIWSLKRFSNNNSIFVYVQGSVLLIGVISDSKMSRAPAVLCAKGCFYW